MLFVISGFVVFLPTVARGGEFGSVAGYAIRRAARLVPAYWVILALGALMIAVLPVALLLELPGPGSVVAHLLFAQTPAQMVHPIPTGFVVNGAVWTLSLEVTFYLLLPLVAVWYARRPLVGLLAAAALTALWHEAFIHLAQLNSSLGLSLSTKTLFRLQAGALSQFPFFAFSFAAGMTGAWAYVRLSRPEAAATVRRLRTPVLVGSLVALALFSYLVGTDPGARLGPEAARRSPLLALGYSGSLASVMVAGALAPAGWQRLFANRIARWLGDISYGVYLVHVLIVTFAVRALGVGGAEGLGIPGTNITGIVGDGSFGYLIKLTVVVVPLSLVYRWLSAHFSSSRSGAGRAVTAAAASACPPNRPAGQARGPSARRRRVVPGRLHCTAAPRARLSNRRRPLRPHPGRPRSPRSSARW